MDDCIRLGELAMKLGAREPLVADNLMDQERLWTARRSLAKTLKQVYAEVLAEDIVVPLAELPAMVGFIAALQQKYGTPVVPFGHVGDGNIHVDVCRASDDRDAWRRTCHALVDELTDRVIAAGGQITAEHGIGTAKLWLMNKALGPAELALMRRLKETLDPPGLMNPGKVLPGERESGEPGS
jgi:glycolate oxidase